MQIIQNLIILPLNVDIKGWDHNISAKWDSIDLEKTMRNLK